MYSKKTFAFIIAAAFLLNFNVFVSAQVDPKPAGDDGKKPDTVVVIREGDDQVEAAVGREDSGDRYKIGFEDTLQVDVFRHPELSQIVAVGRDGTIILPRIDLTIVAVCKTERELASIITAHYRNYLRNPFVNVRTVEQRSQPFAVSGAVNKPGGFYLSHRVRLLDLVGMAGGPDYSKSAARVQVTRVGNLSSCKNDENSESEVSFFAYSLSDVMKGIENPVMEPGDIVTVLEAEEAYVIGNVEEPTIIMLKDPITLTQALAKAGGIGDMAKTSRVVIQRRDPGSRVATELVFDLKEIRAQRTEDPYLQANDIVEVPTDNKKVIRNGLLKVLTGGLSNLFYRFPL